MILLAMDRATVRTLDPNGFLHVEVSNISKANVCPYMGREIPNWRNLGLDPDRIYQLLRDPEELSRAASTFNNLPVLSKHVPVDAEKLPDELIIGSTGNDSAFVAPYLQNRLVVWSAKYQRAINNHRQKQLSSAYRYRADMTAGNYKGLRFDGVMRDIVGNHVALVIEGRAGPDVVVGDEVMKLQSRTALMISGALSAHVRPLLAENSKVDIASALEGVTAASFAMDGAPDRIAEKVVEIVTPHLAQDATCDAEAVAAAISLVQPIAADEDMICEPKAEKPAAKPAKTAKPAKVAEDENDGEEEEPAPAMDQATIAKMIADAEKRGATNVAAIDTAKRDVQPFVGAVVGMDSAASIYRLALDAAKADITDVPESAYRAMVAMLPKPGAKVEVAQDSARTTSHRSDFSKRFPNAAPLVRS